MIALFFFFRWANLWVSCSIRISPLPVRSSSPLGAVAAAAGQEELGPRGQSCLKTSDEAGGVTLLSSILVIQSNKKGISDNRMIRSTAVSAVALGGNVSSGE